MKIGVFDSGLGGLVITKSFRDVLPNHDYVYYGDTANLPYGEKTKEQVLAYTIEAIKFLIKQKCGLIVVACNTATSVALRYLQQKFIPSFAPDIKILGVVIPTVEEAIGENVQKIGVLATQATVESHIYKQELLKINHNLDVIEVASPELVPAIENNDFETAEKYAKQYVSQFNNIDSLILGCTHYPLLKTYLRKYCGESIKIVSQDEIMGKKLDEYLKKHIEIDICLSRNSELKIFASQKTSKYKEVAKLLFPSIQIESIK